MTPHQGLYTSESVAEGHPDKLADCMADAIPDAFLRLELEARVACETLLADQRVVVAGEFRTRAPEAYREVRAQTVPLVTQVHKEAGYGAAATGIDPDRREVQVCFNRQSGDIARGVDRADGQIGAGDQGQMFGYAGDETPELMPTPISFAHRLMRRQADLSRGGHDWLGPDACRPPLAVERGIRPESDRSASWHRTSTSLQSPPCPRTRK